MTAGARVVFAQVPSPDRVSREPVTPEGVADARRALGAGLAAMRRAAGVTQVRLARLVSWSRSTVANVETARQSAPLEFWAACDAVLSAGGALLAAWQRAEALSRRLREQRAVELIRQRLAQPSPGCVCRDLRRLLTGPGTSLPLGSSPVASIVANGDGHG